MANQNEVLRALSTKEEAASPASLAGELRADEATIRTYLNRLKKKMYVEGGGSQWYITDAGKTALEREEEVPTTREDVGEDEISKFRYYGKLSGVPDDKITACIELFQNTDVKSMDEMERILAEMNVPQTQQTQWVNLYRGYLRNTSPPEKREELYPLPKPEAAAPGEEGAAVARGEGGTLGLNYIVEDNNILQVGEGLGMFTFRQALQVVAAKRGTAQKGEGEALTLLSQLDSLGLLRKSGEEGRNTQIELLDKLNQLGVLKTPGDQPSPGSFVDEEGNVQELKPGQPIVVKKVVREQGKTYLLNPDGELEEHEAGKPIIIKMRSEPGGSDLPPMMPFPVMGSDGQPVYDKDGKPVYANLEPMMKYIGFQSEQRMAAERHSALMGLAQTVRENLGDGISALRAAAEEAKGSSESKSSESPPQQPQVFKCADCQTEFSAPPEWAGQPLKCPNPACGREYLKEELVA